ncbi:MAG: hypothetical protein RIG68_15015 [Imperialibacter sp.]|uniref:hypothetical protein n=1 Tax=Imperialibacter sp. TaxID=2038411 RepID=UPI0032F09927
MATHAGLVESKLTAEGAEGLTASGEECFGGLGIEKVGDGSQETEDGRPESEVGRQESEDGSRETEDRRPE